MKAARKKTAGRAITLTDLDLMPAAPIALIDLTLPQLAEAYSGLDRLEKEYENMSGICATLKGLVLLEAKPKAKGHFKAWIEENFPKSYRTAARYMSLAESFGKSDSTGTFQTLTRDLGSSVAALQQFSLDLRHPVISKVAAWVQGRGAYQLMLDLGAAQEQRPVQIGQGLRPNTAKEKFDALEELAAQVVVQIRGCLGCKAWRASTEATLDELIADAEKLAREAKKWRLLPKRARHDELMGELAAQYQAELAEDARRKAANAKRKAAKR